MTASSDEQVSEFARSRGLWLLTADLAFGNSLSGFANRQNVSQKRPIPELGISIGFFAEPSPIFAPSTQLLKRILTIGLGFCHNFTL